MGGPCAAHGLPMGRQWATQGPPMGGPCVANGLPMGRHPSPSPAAALPLGSFPSAAALAEHSSCYRVRAQVLGHDPRANRNAYSDLSIVKLNRSLFLDFRDSKHSIRSTRHWAAL